MFYVREVLLRQRIMWWWWHDLFKNGLIGQRLRELKNIPANWLHSRKNKFCKTKTGHASDRPAYFYGHFNLNFSSVLKKSGVTVRAHFCAFLQTRNSSAIIRIAEKCLLITVLNRFAFFRQGKLGHLNWRTIFWLFLKTDELPENTLPSLSHICISGPSKSNAHSGVRTTGKESWYFCSKIESICNPIYYVHQKCYKKIYIFFYFHNYLYLSR